MKNSFSYKQKNKDMKDIMEQLLKNITLLTGREISSGIFDTTGRTGLWIEINKKYDYEKYYPPGTFLRKPKNSCGHLVLIVGIGSCGCKRCGKSKEMFFLPEGGKGITFWDNCLTKNDFLARGFQLVSE